MNGWPDLASEEGSGMGLFWALAYHAPCEFLGLQPAGKQVRF